MDIIFKRKKDRDLVNNDSKLKQKHKGNQRRHKLIRARLDELADAENLMVLRYLPQSNCHELKGNRKGQLAVNLDKGFRMIFEAANNPIPEKEDGGLDWGRVTAVRILALSEDYHD
jgi:proteic killer suppression protein